MLLHYHIGINMKSQKMNIERRNKLFGLFSQKRSQKETAAIMQDLCTPAELEAMADRLLVLPLIKQGESYKKIHEITGVSITTIGRVARHLHSGHGGYEYLIENDLL